MKKIILFATWLCMASCTAAQVSSLAGKSLFGGINAGYSNYGFIGQAEVNYRFSKFFVEAAYYKAHTCVLDNYKGEYFPDSRSSDYHITINSAALSAGIMFPGRLLPSLSCGIAIQQFTYINTAPEDHILSLPSIWATITNNTYREEVLHAHNVVTAAIPIEFRLHFAQRHNIGFDAGTKVDLSGEGVMVAAMIGIRFGRMVW